MTVLDSPVAAPARRGARWWPRLAILVAGALPVLCFPAPNLSYLAWIVLVPMLLLMRSSPTAGEAAKRGWLAGIAYIAATQYWLAPNLTFFFPFAVLLLSLLWLPFGIWVRALMAGRITFSRALVAAFGVPAGWTLIEAVRSWQWLGGPWSLLGATQWQHPRLLTLASIGGIWLVGVVIVAVNTGVCLLVLGGMGARCVGLVAVLIAGCAGPAVAAARGPIPTSTPWPVAVVQPGVVPSDRLLDTEIAMTRAISRPVKLVVWGESSVSYDLPHRPDILGKLTALSAEMHADLLVDVDAKSPDGAIAKTAMLIDRNGIQGTYEKNRLVPFGEYIPFRDQLSWLTKVTAAAGQNRKPGHTFVTMDVDGVPVGPLTSFEQTFPDLARTVARQGAQLIAYQSSTSTFQDSWAPDQLASFGALRAAETGRPIVQAALTGTSSSFDPRGRRIGWLPSTTNGVMVVEAPLPAEPIDTIYDRFGNYVPVAAAAVVLVILVGSVLDSRVRRR